MKVLAALSVVQIAAILLLLSKVGALDESKKPQPDAEPAAVRQPVEAAAVSAPPAVRAEVDEALLRRIIRQELAAQLDLFQRGGGQEEALAVVDPVEEAEMQLREDLVSDEIRFYVSRGTISDLEMQTLQGEIAKLDKEGQKRMLGQLVRAMNAGELKGRL